MASRTAPKKEQVLSKSALRRRQRESPRSAGSCSELASADSRRGVSSRMRGTFQVRKYPRRQAHQGQILAIIAEVLIEDEEQLMAPTLEEDIVVAEQKKDHRLEVASVAAGLKMEVSEEDIVEQELKKAPLSEVAIVKEQPLISHPLEIAHRMLIEATDQGPWEAPTEALVEAECLVEAQALEPEDYQGWSIYKEKLKMTLIFLSSRASSRRSTRIW